MFGRAVWTPLVQPVAAGVNGTARSQLRPRLPPLQQVVGQALRVTRRAEGGTLTQAAVGIAQGSDPLKVNTVTLVTICILNFAQMPGLDRMTVPRYQALNGGHGTACQLPEHHHHGAAEQAVESTTNHRAARTTATTGLQPHPDRHQPVPVAVPAGRES